MFLIPFQIARQTKLAAITMAASLVFGAFGTPLVATVRLAEIWETSPVNQRTEELTEHGRLDTQRQLRFEERRIALAFYPATSNHLGNTCKPFFSFAHGHRLHNGLLAPITC
jgi:hypothetical protein